jgi:hypothetical protein
MIIILVEKYDSSKEINQTKIFFLNNYKQAVPSRTWTSLSGAKWL